MVELPFVNKFSLLDICKLSYLGVKKNIQHF